MSYERAREEALFLTDKMAYELNLTNAQYEAAYEINLDYLMGVTSRYDVFGAYWERRNMDLQFILYTWQWEAFRAATYFWRPLYWEAGYWHFGVYARYPRRDYFYFGRPHFYVSYRGGHSWRMNGGRSYYEHHRDHFRPHGDQHRDRHVGMRDGWNRGDYRNGARENSSTRVTGRDDNRRHEGRGSVTGGNANHGQDHNGRASENNHGNRGIGSNRSTDNHRSVDNNRSTDNHRSVDNNPSVDNNRSREHTRSVGAPVAERSLSNSRESHSIGGGARSQIAPVQRQAAPQRSVSAAPQRSVSSTPSRSMSSSAPQRSMSSSAPQRSMSSSAPQRSSSAGGSRSAGRR
jgi:hypothetical protein